MCFVFALCGAVVAGCASAPLAGISDARLQGKPAELLIEARRELSAAGVEVRDSSANTLTLSESVGERIAAFAADGSPSQYSVSYRLEFSYNGEKRSVELSETVDHHAGFFHAGQRQREEAARSLRRSAIAEMLYLVGGKQ